MPTGQPAAERGADDGLRRRTTGAAAAKGALGRVQQRPARGAGHGQPAALAAAQRQVALHSKEVGRLAVGAAVVRPGFRVPGSSLPHGMLCTVQRLRSLPALRPTLRRQAQCPKSSAPMQRARAVARRDMEQMNVPQAHKLTKGRRSIVIGIIDGGIDATHPGMTHLPSSVHRGHLATTPIWRSTLNSHRACLCNSRHTTWCR